MSLPTPDFKVQTLQTSLHAKAKAEPSYRFYALWDKVCREDVLRDAYRRCRRNGGAAGVDGEGFAAIDAQGVTRWLANLRQELRTKTYVPQPLRRVWIPKRSGGRRPLGIPTVRDRVVQMAVVLLLEPIFEADLLPQQYGFRRGLDAKMAVRRVYFHLERGLREVVDGDLSDYFTTVPHGDLMRCVTRRVADGQVLSVLKRWLVAPVVERVGRVEHRTTEARDRSRGTPQGGVVSPLLANLYFRRFALAWQRDVHHGRTDACLVNYADDFVICCRPGTGAAAMARMRTLMDRLGLTVNERKTRRVAVPRESFDFLGYTFGRLYGRDGRAYIGTRPSKTALTRVVRRIHDETSRRWTALSVEHRVEELNAVLRGWCGYFNQGPVQVQWRTLQRYTEKRFRRWLMIKHKRRGTGYRQYPDRYLYEVLGLFQPLAQRPSRPRAKA